MDAYIHLSSSPATNTHPDLRYLLRPFNMASSSVFVALAILALVAIHAEASRDLLAMQDKVIANCRTYGVVNGNRVCTACYDDHELMPGGWECARRKSGGNDKVIANCKSYGVVNGNRVCTTCHDDHELLPGGWECTRRKTTHLGNNHNHGNNHHG